MANQAREKRGEDNEFELDFELPEVDKKYF